MPFPAADPGLGCATRCPDGPRPMCASAPTATAGWLLIEHSGPWPAYGYPADLPDHLATAADRLLRLGVRPQLIRRTDRAGRRGDGVRAVFLAGGPEGRRWLERVDPDTLTTRQVNRGTFSAPRTAGLGRPHGPLLLVCTHGSREVCCARYGRPVAMALAANLGPMVWETTHVGGDEYAANLVLLPRGVYFGRLSPERAVRVAERALAGDLDLGAYRGVAGRSEASQNAEWHLRRALDETRLDAIRALPSREGDPGYLYRFAREDEHYAVETRGSTVTVTDTVANAATRSVTNAG